MLLAGADAVGETQHIAVSPAIALPILHQLIGQCASIAPVVPGRDTIAQPSTPATELLYKRQEVKQVSAGARHQRQRIERRSARRLIADAGAHRQHEQRLVVLRRAPTLADGHRALDDPCAVGIDAARRRVGILQREWPLGGVVAPTLATEN